LEEVAFETPSIKKVVPGVLTSVTAFFFEKYNIILGF
jgi:hypothetical protein